MAARTDLFAQGTTTAAIRGTVRSIDGAVTEHARVSITNTTTGYRMETVVREGRFVSYGLETGGPYTIIIEGAGLALQRRDRIFLKLGAPLDLVFIMQPLALELDTLRATARSLANAHAGTAMTVPDSLLHRLPSLNRDLYDFVRLVPQVSTNIGFQTGMSGGGVGFRFNNFLINGVSERTVLANATTALAGGKSLPLEAVREYQVLLAPYDVRYGDFAGAMVNTVTRSGTNKLAGSVFAYARNDRLRRGSTDSQQAYERAQFGFALGGPLVRDRLHFFIAPELQRFTSSAEGPYVGQPASTTSPVPVRPADIIRLESIMRTHGLVAGSAGAFENSNPLTNIFARLDAAQPKWNSRAVLWSNYARVRDDRFSRPNGGESFPLTTFLATPNTRALTTALQVHTLLPRVDGHNELIISRAARNQETLPPVRQPVVRVLLPRTSGGTVTVNTGTTPSAQGTFTHSRTIRIADDLTLPLASSHVLTLGVAGERFRVVPGGAMGSYGTWTFSSLDSLERGLAERYELSKDFDNASPPIVGTQYAMYAGNEWNAGGRLSMTVGMRADLLAIHSRAPYNVEVDSIFGRRTDVMPARRVHWSPRIGFTWIIDDAGHHQLRGGTGIFTGRPPMAWANSALLSYGAGIGRLTCGPRPAPLDLGPTPNFEPDYRKAPQSCANGSSINTAPRGDVDLLDPQLGMAQTLRASLAYDRQLRSDLSATAEVLVTRNLNDFLFVNLNLEGPQAIGRNGRVLYGTIDASGISRPRLRWPGSFEVIDLRNISSNRSHQISASVEKRFTKGASAVASYTFTRARDVQTPLRTGVRGTINWSSRALSGRHDDLSTGISLNDIPHRVILAGTHRIQWRWPTEISFYFVGESGSPFTYLAWGSGTRGDLNADGSNTNDPIYIPRNAMDAGEIAFEGGDGAQQMAFERFIESTPCLRRQRGQIMERNSCREPWSNTTVAAVRQIFGTGKRAIEAQLDVYNVLNLIDSDWGLRRRGTPEFLEHVRQAAEDPSQPVFLFNTSSQWQTVQSELFQLQLALRYRF